MKHRNKLIILIIFVFLGIHTSQIFGQETKKPNILYILVDQWRAQAVGYAGDKNAITPNLDKLASESINLKNAISGTPVCTPHRASLMTGQYPLTNGMFMNDVLLDSNAVSMAKVFSKAGYNTGYVGKWHLDGHGRNSYIPPTRQQGFQYWKALECSHDYNNSGYYVGDSKKKMIWNGYDVIAETEDIISYMKNQASRPNPFLMFISIGSPHDPYQTAPEKYRKMYENKELIISPNVPADKLEKVKKDLLGYYSHITAIDESIGRMWNTLKDLGIDENTIIVFSSDHGDLLGSHGAWNKQQPYEESLRVPFLIHYPKMFGKKPKSLSTLLNSPDIMPTLLGLSKIKIPSSVEGKDFSRILKGTKKDKVSQTLIACYQPFGQWDRQRGGKEYRGVYTGKYTYTRDLIGPWLLFDNENDPFQMNNLIGKPDFAILQKDMDKKLESELRKRNDKFEPGMEYIRKWNYVVDETETVPYLKINYEGKPIVE